MKCCRGFLATFCAVLQLLDGRTSAAIRFTARDVGPVHRVRCPELKGEAFKDAEDMDVFCIVLNRAPASFSAKICRSTGINITHKAFEEWAQSVVGYRGMTDKPGFSYFEVFLLDCNCGHCGFRSRSQDRLSFNCIYMSNDPGKQLHQQAEVTLQTVTELTCCVGDPKCGKGNARTNDFVCDDAGTALPTGSLAKDEPCDISGRNTSISIRRELQLQDGSSQASSLTVNACQEGTISYPNKRLLHESNNVGLVFSDCCVSGRGAVLHSYVFHNDSNIRRYTCRAKKGSKECDKSLTHKQGEEEKQCSGRADSSTQRAADKQWVPIVMSLMGAAIVGLIVAIVVIYCKKKNQRRPMRTTDPLLHKKQGEAETNVDDENKENIKRDSDRESRGSGESDCKP